ncbi:MAG TPA: hypothetical protein VF630_16405 [Hymenobacter sp.]|jgi:hypothetical protein
MANDFTSSSVGNKNMVSFPNIIAGLDNTLCAKTNGCIVIPAGKGGLYLVNMSG